MKTSLHSFKLRQVGTSLLLIAFVVFLCVSSYLYILQDSYRTKLSSNIPVHGTYVDRKEQYNRRRLLVEKNIDDTLSWQLGDGFGNIDNEGRLQAKIDVPNCYEAYGKDGELTALLMFSYDNADMEPSIYYISADNPKDVVRYVQVAKAPGYVTGSSVVTN